MGDGVSVREFARQIGKSHVLVLNLIKSGVLPRNDDGTIPLEEGFNAYKTYMSAPKKHGRPKKAEKKTPKKKAAVSKKTKRVKKKAASKPKTKNIEPEEISDEVISDSVDLPPYLEEEHIKDAVSTNAVLNQSKAKDKFYQAQNRELDYRVRKGELLEASDVAREAQWLAEQVKSKLLAIPPRISSMCEGRIARDIEEIIEDAINDALKELQKSKYGGGDNK